MVVLRIDSNGKEDHLADYYSQPGKRWWWLGPDGSSEGGEKQPHSRHILKFSQQDLLMDWNEKKERTCGPLQGFSLGNWRIYQDGKPSGEAGLGEEGDPELELEHVT